MQLVGLKKIQQVINSATQSTWPKSTIIQGEKGSGKHTICTILAENLGVDITNITDKINKDVIDEIYENYNISLYIIDGDILTVKAQNTLLKLLEEPPKNVFLVIVVEKAEVLLPTVRNRCQIYSMDTYSEEELKQFIDDSLDIEALLAIAHTPGQIQQIKEYNLEELQKLAETIYLKIHVANYANTLSILKKIGFKQEKEKYDPRILSRILFNTIVNLIKTEYSSYRFQQFMLAKKLLNDVNSSYKYDYEYLYAEFLSDLWKCGRGVK